MATDVKILIGAVDATGGVISKVSNDLKAAQREAATSAEVFKSMGTALSGAFSVGAIVSFGKSILDAQMSVQKMTNAMTAVTGSNIAAQQELSFVRQEAERLGLGLESAAGSYTKLAASAMGTAMAGEQTQKLFSAVSSATTVLGLSGEEASRIFNQLSQMMSKGTVQAEELKTVSESLPGTYNLVASAMGVTTAELTKMMEQGRVTANDMLPKLSAQLLKTFGPQAEEASRSTRSELEKFKTALFDLKKEALDGDVFSKFFQGATYQTKVLAANLDGVKAGLTAMTAALMVESLMKLSTALKTVGTMGMFARAGIVGAAGFVGYQVGSMIDGAFDLSGKKQFEAEQAKLSEAEARYAEVMKRRPSLASVKDTNSAQRQQLEAAILKEQEAGRQKELADLNELFTWQENRIQQLKEIDAELKAIRDTETEKADFERTMAELETKAAERKIKDQITELENTAKQTEALKTLQMELLKLDAEYQAETAEQAKLNGLVDKRTSLTTQLEIATLKKDKATADGLTAQLALLDQLIGKTKQQITLSTEAQIRQNILTGATVGVYLDANGNPVQVGANSWESQNQYVSNSQLTGSNSGPVSFSDSAFSPGQITGGNSYIINVSTLATDAAGAAKAILPAIQQLHGRIRA